MASISTNADSYEKVCCVSEEERAQLMRDLAIIKRTVHEVGCDTSSCQSFQLKQNRKLVIQAQIISELRKRVDHQKKSITTENEFEGSHATKLNVEKDFVKEEPHVRDNTVTSSGSSCTSNSSVEFQEISSYLAKKLGQDFNMLVVHGNEVHDFVQDYNARKCDHFITAANSVTVEKKILGKKRAKVQPFKMRKKGRPFGALSKRTVLYLAVLNEWLKNKCEELGVEPVPLRKVNKEETDVDK